MPKGSYERKKVECDKCGVLVGAIPGGQRAHRVAYALASGRHPGKLQVCHTCDVRPCVKPAHLFVGTQLDNMRDMIAKGRKVVVSGEAHPMKDLARREAMSGENHWSKRLPDRVANGDRHWARKHPDEWHEKVFMARESMKERKEVTQ